MAVLAERLEEALLKAAKSGKRLAEADLKNKERGRGRVDTFWEMLYLEWKGDCRAVADLIKVMDESEPMGILGGPGEMFGGRVWRRD